MRDFVKAGFDIAFYDPLIRAGREVMNLGHRVMRPTIRTKPVTARAKVRLKIGSNTSFKDAWATRSRIRVDS